MTPCYPRQETAEKERERKERNDVLGGCHWEQRESSFEEKKKEDKEERKNKRVC